MAKKNQNLVYWYRKVRKYRDTALSSQLCWNVFHSALYQGTLSGSDSTDVGRAHFLFLVRSLQISVYSQNSFIHSLIHSFFFFETGIWSCIFLVIGITWSYLFLVWSYKIYLTWLFLYEENKRMFFIKQFLFFFMSVDFHVIDNFISLSDYGNQRKHLTPSNWMQGCS